MFTTNFGFRFPSLTILVNVPLTLLSFIDQLVQHPTRIPDRFRDTSNILDRFLTYCHLFSSVGYFQSQFYIYILSYLSNPSSGSSKAEVPWHFAFASWGDLKKYNADFPWNDNCFRVGDLSLCAESIAEVLVSGIEAYISHSFSRL